MIAKLIIHPNLANRLEETDKLIKDLRLLKNHPAVLWFEAEDKLGVEQAKQIKEFLNLKPYQGDKSAVIIEAAENLTLDAQNALLKTLEELPDHATILLGASAEEKLLPTIISRCQIISPNPNTTNTSIQEGKYYNNIQLLLTQSFEKRFQYIEKLETREEFLKELIAYFRDGLLKGAPFEEFIKELIKAEGWANQNVNIRAILEYLMLKMPKFERA